LIHYALEKNIDWKIDLNYDKIPTVVTIFKKIHPNFVVCISELVIGNLEHMQKEKQKAREAAQEAAEAGV